MEITETISSNSLNDVNKLSLPFGSLGPSLSSQSAVAVKIKVCLQSYFLTNTDRISFDLRRMSSDDSCLTTAFLAERRGSLSTTTSPAVGSCKL